MNDETLISLIVSIIVIVFFILLYNKISAIASSAKKQTYLLTKMYQKSGGELSESEKKWLSNL